MKKEINRLIIVCIVFISGFSFGQTFSPNREKFIKEFQKTLSDFGKGDYQDFAKKEFPKLLLESTDFPEAYFTKMVETCNLMVTKRIQPFPEMYQYVFSIASLVKGKQSEKSYTAWHNSVDKLLDAKNIKKFEDFIDLSAGFFLERKIAETPNFKWFYENGDYSFEFTDKPFIKCSNGNLICRIENRNSQTKKDQPNIDSLVIFKTNGTYDPVLKKWFGTGGILTWEKVGLPKNETFAELKNYDVSCKTSNLIADTVALTTKYFSKPILGYLSDRAFIINREEDKVYPQFLSYEKRLTIKSIKENVDYEGGFTMKGSNFVGMGAPKNPAKIFIYRDKQIFIKASAQEIFITPATIYCNNAGSAIYLKTGDSISHSGLNFNYDLKKKSIEFTRTGKGGGQSPFQDSYHQTDIYVAKITWKLEESTLYFTYDFGISQEQRYARFDSKSYFDEQLYDRLQGLESIHPLVAISKYCYKYDEYSINEGKAATALGKTTQQAIPMLLELSNNGFIAYDTEGKMVTINPKLENFVAFKAGKKDYDNLSFISDLRPKELTGFTDEEIQADPNLQRIKAEYKKLSEERRTMAYFGKMDLGTLEIDLNAVDRINVSTAQNTLVFPTSNRVKIKENRNFEFSGWINAGKLEINTLAANYNYKENAFTILNSKESILRVRPFKVEDGKQAIPMASSLIGLKGQILVDDPNNRSGKNQTITSFPKLVVSNPSVIYYNAKNIYKGAYDSTRFYYTVAPFTRDSLDNFAEKSLRLKGELTSAGIFPKISQDLKIMADYSFGFSTSAPKGGYDFYGTGAKYENKIMLSNNGLQGAGTINFVHSTSISNALSFLPDSTIGLAKFTNRPMESGIEFPDVDAEEAFITYVPRKNYLKAQSTQKHDLSFFKGEAKLRGVTIVTAQGLRGNGLMTFKSATTLSSNYSFKRWEINADTAGFSLKNTYAEEGEDPISFKADNVKASISFKDRKGDFNSNFGTSRVNFPVNQYYCLMDKFSWLMDKADIVLEKTDKKTASGNSDMDLAGPNFFSSHPKQDSLQFGALRAKYDLKQRTIFCESVEFLQIADARIFPDSMKVAIRQKARMEPLTNARIVANYITKYHSFVRANVEVTARRAYKADGDYPYYDKDSNLTYLKMNRIALDTSFQTIAKGDVADNQGFKLSKEFDYYGKVQIAAANPMLFFEGATRINHSCDKFDKNWMSFSAPIDPKNIQIPVSTKMKDLAGESISAGIVWRNSTITDSIKLYPTFLSKLVQKDDPILISASGVLQYNEQAKEFQISSKEKLVNRSEKGNFLALHTESCSMNGEGIVDLGMNYGDVKVDAVGIVNYNQSSGETILNLTTRINMAMDKGLMEGIATRLNTVEGLKEMDFKKTTLEQALLEWTDQKTADRLVSDYTLKGEIKKIPSELESAIVLTGLRLVSFDKPSVEEKGIISSSKTAVLVNMFDKPVLKYVPISAFFQQIYSESGGDKFGLFLQIPGGSSYYFDYSMDKKDGEMRIISDDVEFNAAATLMKEEKRKTKNFKFEVSTQQIYLSKFLRLFE